MAEQLRSLRASALDRALLPLHRWVWQDAERRARKLLRFAETEADGGRDLSRADEAMTNICRCGTYQRIRAAVHMAAGMAAGSGSVAPAQRKRA